MHKFNNMLSCDFECDDGIIQIYNFFSSSAIEFHLTNVEGYRCISEIKFRDIAGFYWILKEIIKERPIKIRSLDFQGVVIVRLDINDILYNICNKKGL